MVKALLAISAALLASLALAACASYDQAETEKTILSDLSKQTQELTGSKIKSASCPAELDVKKGATFECTATLSNGKELQVDGKVENDAGDYTVEIAPEELRGAFGGSG